MNIVFADANFYIALLSSGDQHGMLARKIASAHQGQWVTTTAVLTEVGNFLSAPRSRLAFVGLVRTLQSSPRVAIIPETLELWKQSIELYASRPDKAWSLTDCQSFLVMQTRQILHAATADHHFEQAGFEILLK